MLTSHSLRTSAICIATAAVCLVATASASALTMSTPTDGAAYNTNDTVWRGAADPNFSISIRTIVHNPLTPGLENILWGASPLTFGLQIGYNDVNLQVGGPTNNPAFPNRSYDYTGQTITPLSDDWEYTGFPPSGGYLGGWPDGHYAARANYYGDDGPEYVVARYDIDTKVPETVLDTTPPAFDNDATPSTFTFHADDPAPSSGVSFECRIDAGAWAPCVSGAPISTPEGNRTFAVRAKDKAGNTDPTPETYAWMVDTTPPVVTITTPPNRVHYTLRQPVTAVYDCNDPLSGGPPPVASGLVAPCSAPPVDTTRLGTRTFSVTATDRAGNSTTTTHAYVVDPPRYEDAVLDKHPLAYYPLNDPVGSDVMADRSGRGHDGEFKNGIALRRDPAIACHRRPTRPAACDRHDDPQGWAAFFPARDGYGFANGITAPQSAYSLEAWVKPADGADMSVVGQGGGGQLFITGRRLALRQTQDTVIAPGPNLPIGAWSHVAGTWDGHTTRLFVNGVQVASSTSANKPPSGSATLYVGYGDQAPWFHGDLDEVAYYDSALTPDDVFDHHAIGTVRDEPSPGPGPLNTARPTIDIATPADDGQYAPAKLPVTDFTCDDPDGPADVAGCTATVDGTPIGKGVPIAGAPGEHVFTVTAVDLAGNTFTRTHHYWVAPFSSIIGWDHPVAYYRLGDDTGAVMADASGNGRNGEYKNDQESGPVGIAGDGDHARRFYGAGGYGYVNGITAPRHQATIEAWIRADDGRDQSIAGHGDAGELLIQGGHFVFRHMDQRVSTSIGVTPGQWTQVVGVWDGVDLKIYVDGILRGTQEATRRPSSASTFYVGYGELAPWFKGAIDEVAYYDTALTPGRVFQHWLADPPPETVTAVTTPSAPTTTTSPATTDPGTPAATPPITAAPSGGGSTDTPSLPTAPRFAITAVKASSSRLAVSVTLPGAGRVAIVSTTRAGGRTITYRSGSTRVAADTRTITLSPTAAARRALKKARSLRVSLRLTYTPTGGKASTVTRSVTVKGGRR